MTKSSPGILSSQLTAVIRMPAKLSPKEILAKLIAFPTVSRDTNIPLIDWVETYLTGHGITCHRHLHPSEPKAALFAHVGPEVEGAVVLSGHTDVVPVDGQAWDTDPFELVEKDGKYFGRGTADMKGFDALAIWAMVEAQYADISTPLQIALSYDEEIGCVGADPLIAAMDGVVPKGRIVIVGEPTMMQVVTGHKGGISFNTHLVGYEVHSSLMDRGVSAIHEGARLIQWANDENERLSSLDPTGTDALFDPSYTTWHVGRIEGGTAHNITAKDCIFQMGFRAVPGDDPIELSSQYAERVAQLRKKMKAVHPDADILLNETFNVPPLRPEVQGAAEELARRLTGDNSTHVVSYGTEAGFFQAAGYSAVVCGPGNIEQAHQPNEWVSIPQFNSGADFLGELVALLSK